MNPDNKRCSFGHLFSLGIAREWPCTEIPRSSTSALQVSQSCTFSQTSAAFAARTLPWVCIHISSGTSPRPKKTGSPRVARRKTLLHPQHQWAPRRLQQLSSYGQWISLAVRASDIFCIYSDMLLAHLGVMPPSPWLQQSFTVQEAMICSFLQSSVVQ